MSAIVWTIVLTDNFMLINPFGAVFRDSINEFFGKNLHMFSPISFGEIVPEYFNKPCFNDSFNALDIPMALLHWKSPKFGLPHRTTMASSNTSPTAPEPLKHFLMAAEIIDKVSVTGDECSSNF